MEGGWVSDLKAPVKILMWTEGRKLSDTFEARIDKREEALKTLQIIKINYQIRLQLQKKQKK